MANQSDTEKKQEGTTLPMVIEAQARSHSEATSWFRYRLDSTFASHLVASKLRMANQRPLRRAPTNYAVEQYRAANARKVRRMPAGFNRTLDA